MKNITRSSLVAISLAATLGLTGCGISQSDMGVGAGSSNPSQSQKSEENPNKPVVWTEKLDGSLHLPPEWNEGAGWKASVKTGSLTSIGEYVAYVENSNGKALVIDGKGDKKFSTDSDGEFEGGATSTLKSVRQDGKDYLAVVQSGEAKKDPSSVKKAGPQSIVHVFDSEMNEKWSKTFPGYINLQNDMIAIAGPAVAAGTSTTSSYIDIETGESKVLTVPTGYNWVGRYDGVDIFSLISATGGKGELTNGVWKVTTVSEMGLSSDSTPAPKSFGSMIQTKRPAVDGRDSNACDLIDPKTGKVFDIGVATGSCITEVFSSPDDNYIHFRGGGGTNDGVLSIKDKQVFFITSDIEFTPTSVNNDGLVYGKSGDGVALFDFKKDTEPKIHDAKRAPIMVAKNGIAGFSEDYFAVKK